MQPPGSSPCLAPTSCNYSKFKAKCPTFLLFMSWQGRAKKAWSLPFNLSHSIKFRGRWLCFEVEHKVGVNDTLPWLQLAPIGRGSCQSLTLISHFSLSMHVCVCVCNSSGMGWEGGWGGLLWAVSDWTVIGGQQRRFIGLVGTRIIGQSLHKALWECVLC